VIPPTGGSAGDAALVEAYLRNREGLVLLASQLTGDPAQAEDLVEEVFVRLLQRRRSSSGSRYILTYPFLHTAVMNAARNHLRDEGNRARLQQERREEIVESAVIMPTPEWRVRFNELVAAIEDAAVRLPGRQREVFRLTLDGLSPAEIATELGITPANAREQLRRARTTVSSRLKDRRVL